MSNNATKSLCLIRGLMIAAGIGLCLFGCGPPPSRFDRLTLRPGMPRAQVEAQVAELLGTANSYSTYGNSLAGGVVDYRDGGTVLELTYAAGAPAPWVTNPDGTSQHYPPVDETVISWRIKRARN